MRLKTLMDAKGKIIDDNDKCSLCLQDITDSQRDEHYRRIMISV